MGLDQYAYAVNKENEKENEKGREEIAYWRKHNRLQGWMDELWTKKGNEGEFNCQYLELTMEDILELEKTIKDKNLPETTGFFFGNDSYVDYEEYDMPNDIKFIKRAKKELKAGKKIVYTCWY